MTFQDTPPDKLQDASDGDGALGVARTVEGAPDWRQIARECYDASTSWINAGRRAKWSDSLRSFQSRHPSGSKYLSTDYRYRSRLFRPKTRAMVRKAEMQTAAAFFSNQDVVSISPQDDDNPAELASAAILQELLQYRLTKTIPWYLTVVGARQDCEVMGICASKQYWRYREKPTGETTMRPRLDPVTGQPQLDDQGVPLTEVHDVMKKAEDRPVVELIPPENIRFDPGADWRDPIATSPYVIHLIPMFADEVQAKMDSGEWFSLTLGTTLASTDVDDDTTRRAREQGRIPGKDHDAGKPRLYEIVWVHENIIRYQGEDMHYFSLGTGGKLLTDPVPLSEVYFTGERPFALGYVNLEAHKTYPDSKVELMRELQMGTNDLLNLRLDHLKLTVNPRQKIRSGSGIDLQDARTFMPGKSMVMKDPINDIVWEQMPQVPMQAFAEQDRFNVDFDELAGDFSAATMAAGQNPVVPETVGGMEQMAAPAASMNDYELRTFATTWVEPVLRQLVKLEQKYETDPVVLAIAGARAQLYQKFGVSQITDELLAQELTVQVNVGLGATNPMVQLGNFVKGAQIIGQLFGPAAAQGANFEEVTKEIMGKLGYKDGARFFKPGFDPRVQQLQDVIQQLQAKIKQPAPPDPMRLQGDMAKAQAGVQQAKIKAASDMHDSDMDYATEIMRQEAETRRSTMKMVHDAAQAQIRPHPALAGLTNG